MANQIPSNELVAAGKATATTTEGVIDVENKHGGFREINIDCTKCTSEIALSIDRPFNEADKIIYISEGLVFEKQIPGDKIYYKCDTGTNTFNYVLL